MLKKVLEHFRFSGKSANILDVRSRRFIAVIDCILNQNARDSGAAQFPAMNFELIQICHEHQLGLLQMPCPEIAALGFKRMRAPGKSIRDALDTEEGRVCCTRLAREVANRIQTYLAEGFELVAVLGGNPRSPGCAVIDGKTSLHSDSGVFMKALQVELGDRKMAPVFKAIRDYDPELLKQDLQTLRDLLEDPYRRRHAE